MSLAAMKWALDLADGRLGPYDKLVLIALADWAAPTPDEDGEACWPSLRRVVARCAMTERGVQGVIARLVEWGFLTVESRTAPSGRSTSNFYRFVALGRVGEGAPGAGEGAPHAPIPPHGVRGDPAPDAPISPHGAHPHYVEPIERTQKRTVRVSRAHARPTDELPLGPAPRQSDPAPSCDPAPKTPPAKRGARLPPDWEPDEVLVAYARKHGVDPDKAAEEFGNYWHGRPGKDAAKLDWGATFRNRVVELAERGRFPLDQRPPQAGPPSLPPELPWRWTDFNGKVHHTKPPAWDLT